MKVHPNFTTAVVVLFVVGPCFMVSTLLWIPVVLLALIGLLPTWGWSLELIKGYDKLYCKTPWGRIGVL